MQQALQGAHRATSEQFRARPDKAAKGKRTRSQRKKEAWKEATASEGATGADVSRVLPATFSACGALGPRKRAVLKKFF